MNRKGFSLVVILLVVVGIFIVIAFYVFWFHWLNGVYNEQAPSIGTSLTATSTTATTGSSVASPTSSANVTPGWQTYSDPEFTIQVPGDWTASTTSLVDPPSLPGDSTGTPYRSITFNSQAYGNSVLIIDAFPHGFDIVDRSDDAPAYLASNGQQDFYFYTWNGDVPAALSGEVKQALSNFQIASASVTHT